MIIFHFLLSLTFVILFTASSILYYFYGAKFVYWLFNFVKTIPRLLWHLLWFETKEVKRRVKEIPSLTWSLKTLWIKRIFLFLLFLNLFIYIQQLVYWNGKGSANHNAKCYYASGNVVAAYRSGLASILTPHNILTIWLEIPQRIIYTVAKPLISEDDGEIALWGYHWFVYPYAKRFNLPPRLLESDWNPLVRDEGAVPSYIWQFIKAVHADNFKDKKMREEHALRNLPLAALYLDELYNHEKVYPSVYVSKEAEESIAQKPIEYSEWQQMIINGPNKEESAYYQKSFDRLWMVNQKSYYICTTAYEALHGLEQKWRTSEFMRQELMIHPSLEATRIAAMIAMLHGGAMDFKFDKEEMTCQDPYVLHYARLRQQFMEIKGSSQLMTGLINRTVNHISADRMKYIFDKYCDTNLSGGYQMKFGTGPSRYANRPLTIKYGQVLLKNKQTQEDIILLNDK